MSQPMRAVYEGGRLRLLGPVDLDEGQEVGLIILSEQDQVRHALSDLLVHAPEPGDAPEDEAALIQEIDAAVAGIPPVSAAIIEERRTGP